VRINPTALLGNMALLYQPSKQQAIYIAFGSGFRAPNIDDMGTLGIVDFRYELPTSGLRPEKSQHTELGYKWRSGKLAANAAVYYMHLSNLITRVKMEGQSIGGYPVYRKENTEAAFIKGAEAAINWRPNKRWQLDAAMAYTQGTNLSQNEPMRRIPPFNGRLATSYRHKKWMGTAEWQFAAKQTKLAKGDKDDNRIPAGGTPGWQIINLYTGYQWHWLQVNMGLQNLLNKDYRTHGSGINGVGRSAWVSCIVKIN
jgi:hemoglobin/transferrin/lactoferrin receptor protein